MTNNNQNNNNNNTNYNNNNTYYNNNLIAIYPAYHVYIPFLAHVIYQGKVFLAIVYQPCIAIPCFYPNMQYNYNYYYNENEAAFYDEIFSSLGVDCITSPCDSNDIIHQN